MPEQLLDHIARFVDLSQAHKDLIASTLSLRQFPKKKLLLKPAQVCDSLYFVVSGALRFYSTKENGDEQVLQFALPNWWMSDYQSLENGMAAGHYIETLEDSELVVMTKKQRDVLFEEIPLFERYFRLLMQRAYAASLTKFHYIFTGSREKIYSQFVHLYPGFAQTVPQYMLASFLGMTPEFLSKIRGKKTRAGN